MSISPVTSPLASSLIPGLAGLGIDAAIQRFGRLEALCAGDPTSHSLHDYVSYETAAAAVRSGQRSVAMGLLGSLAGPHSLSDLEKTIGSHQALRHRFQLTASGHELRSISAQGCQVLSQTENQGLPSEIKEPLQAFIATVDLKRHGLLPVDGAEGFDAEMFVRIPSVFLSALYRLDRSGLVAGELENSRSRHAGFLRLCRLFRLLDAERAHRPIGHKLKEFRWPFGAVAEEAGVAVLRGGLALAGTCQTGFFEDPFLAASVSRFWRSASVFLSEPLVERSHRWQMHFARTVSLGDARESPRLAALLSYYDDDLSRMLARRMISGEISVAIYEDSDMNAYVESRAVKRKLKPRVENIHAHFEHPVFGDPSPRVVLRAETRHSLSGVAGHAREWVANLRHEGRHIAQIEERGAAWLEQHFNEFEIEASLDELLMRLAAGEESHYRLVNSLSAFGPVMGLRNYVDQIHWRGREIPA